MAGRLCTAYRVSGISGKLPANCLDRHAVPPNDSSALFIICPSLESETSIINQDLEKVESQGKQKMVEEISPYRRVRGRLLQNLHPGHITWASRSSAPSSLINIGHFVTVFWRFPDIHSEAEFIWKLCHFKWHSLKNKNTKGSDRIIRIKTCTSPGGAKNQLNAKRTYMPNCQNCYTGLENDCSIHFYKKMAFYFWYYLILFDTDIWYLVPLNFM